MKAILIAAGVYLLTFGPLPPPFPFFNQVLGLALIVGGPIAVGGSKGG